MAKQKSVGGLVAESLHKRFRRKCVENGLRNKWVLERLLERWVDGKIELKEGKDD